MQRIVPEGYNQLMPYLIVRNAAGFVAFVKSVFGATEKSLQMRDEATIMHAEVRIGEAVVMIAEATDDYPVCNGGMFVYVADADAAYNKALQAGATSLMEMTDKPYGRTGGIMDPYGNTWWITTDTTKTA